MVEQLHGCLLISDLKSTQRASTFIAVQRLWARSFAFPWKSTIRWAFPRGGGNFSVAKKIEIIENRRHDRQVCSSTVQPAKSRDFGGSAACRLKIRHPENLRCFFGCKIQCRLWFRHQIWSSLMSSQNYLRKMELCLSSPLRRVRPSRQNMPSTGRNIWIHLPPPGLLTPAIDALP